MARFINKIIIKYASISVKLVYIKFKLAILLYEGLYLTLAEFALSEQTSHKLMPNQMSCKVMQLGGVVVDFATANSFFVYVNNYYSNCQPIRSVLNNDCVRHFTLLH